MKAMTKEQEQLLFKAISFYLPYDLKVRTDKERVVTLNPWHIGAFTIFDKETQMYTPILHPLSKLTEEIEHNGEKFVPIEIIKKKYPNLEINEYFDYLYNDPKLYGLLPLMVIELLLEWHFDVYNLIPQGLAIEK